MNMKKIPVLLLALFVFPTLVSCGGGNENDNINIATQSAESITPTVNSAVPTEKPKLKTVPWGQDGYTNLLPDCVYGSVTQITAGADTCLVLVEQIEGSDALAYIDLLVKDGFTCVAADADLQTAGKQYVKSDVSVTVVHASGMMTLMISK